MALSLKSAMACKVQNHQRREPCGQEFDTRISKYACIGDATESTRNRLERALQVHLHASSYEDTGCQGGGGQRMEKRRKMPAWQMTKVKSEGEVLEVAPPEQRTVQFAALMDTCHLKNPEFEQKSQKYKTTCCSEVTQ